MRWSTGVRVPCTAAHAHVCMHTLRVACLPVLYVGSSRVTTGWRVILSASGWADLTSRVWRTQLRCDPEPRLWPGGFGTFSKRTDMSGDALGTRSLSTPLPRRSSFPLDRSTTRNVYVRVRVCVAAARVTPATPLLSARGVLDSMWMRAGSGRERGGRRQKPALRMPRIRLTVIRTEPDPRTRVAAVELSARPTHHA